jgi:hypothetical protein
MGGYPYYYSSQAGSSRLAVVAIWEHKYRELVVERYITIQLPFN